MCRRRSSTRSMRAWLDKRVGATAANFDAWREQLKALAASAAAKHDDDGVIAAAPAVIKLYPEYVGDANAYEFLADGAAGEREQAGGGGCAAGYMRSWAARIRRR